MCAGHTQHLPLCLRHVILDHWNTNQNRTVKHMSDNDTAFLFVPDCLILTTIDLSAGKMFKLFSTEFLLNEYAYIQTFKKVFSKINFKWTSISSSFKVDMNLICLLAIFLCACKHIEGLCNQLGFTRYNKSSLPLCRLSYFRSSPWISQSDLSCLSSKFSMCWTLFFKSLESKY